MSGVVTVEGIIYNEMNYLETLIKKEEDEGILARLKAATIPEPLKSKLDNLRWRTAAHISAKYWKSPSGEIRVYFNAFSGRHRHIIKNNFIVI